MESYFIILRQPCREAGAVEALGTHAEQLCIEWQCVDGTAASRHLKTFCGHALTGLSRTRSWQRLMPCSQSCKFTMCPWPLDSTHSTCLFYVARRQIASSELMPPDPSFVIKSSIPLGQLTRYCGAILGTRCCH
eukprot:365241-Chlamydomonas_euryale.AAC.3